MARFDLTLLGDAEVAQTLATLTERIERKILVAAFRTAALGVRRAAQQNIRPPRVRFAPGTGKRKAKRLQRFALRFARLRNNLHVVPLKRRKHRIGFSVVTGTRAELGLEQGGRYYYPAHVEAGHAPPGQSLRRRARMSAISRVLFRREMGSKRTPPHPYLRPALKSREGEVLNTLAARIRAGIAREQLKQG